MSPPPGKRLPTSSGSRDVRIPYTPAKGTELLAVPHEVTDAVTGVLAGPALSEARAKRPTNERLERLELDKDKTHERLGKIEVAVANIDGKMAILPQLVSALQDNTRAMQDREKITLTASVELDKAERLDGIDARKQRRRFAYKVGTACLGIGGLLVEVLHKFGVL